MMSEGLGKKVALRDPFLAIRNLTISRLRIINLACAHPETKKAGSG